MSTTIHDLPVEIIELILAELANSCGLYETLRYALVTKAWSNFLLGRLYETVKLMLHPEDSIHLFIDHSVKDRYRVTSLLLMCDWPDEEDSDYNEDIDVPPTDANLVLDLLNSLQGHPLRKFELVADGHQLPLELWEHPLLSGLEWLVLAAGFNDYETIAEDREYSVVEMRLKRLSVCGEGLFNLEQMENCLEQIISSSLNPTPTITHLDLGQVDLVQYHLWPDALEEDLKPLYPLLPVISTLSIPFYGLKNYDQCFQEILPLSTSLSHFILILVSHFEEGDLSLVSDHLRACLESIPSALVSLTLHIPPYLDEKEKEDVPFDYGLLRVIEDFMDQTVLQGMKRCSIHGVRGFKLEGAEDGDNFMMKMRERGVRVDLYRDNSYS